MSTCAARSIVIANAGSGKTWTLATRVLAWCIEDLRANGQARPAQLLAVTFTRKAAGEILDRILLHAAKGATDPRAREEFAPIVGEASAEEYRAVLVALCRDLHLLQVGTIDGFFSRIASALAEEVGLGEGWSIGEDRVLTEIRASVAAQILATDSELRLLNLLSEGAPSPSVTRAIEQLLGGGGFGRGGVSVLAQYRATVSTAADDAARRANVAAAWHWIDRLRDLQVSPREALADLAVALRAEALPPNKDGTLDSRWVRQREQLAQLIEAGDGSALSANTLLPKLARGDSHYSKSPSDSLIALAQKIGVHVRAAVLKKFSDRVSGALSVLPLADSLLDAAHAERGAYGFADISRLVARAAASANSRVSEVDALCAALGCTIHDLAIDEAQDTSAEQFTVLRPLIERVLLGGANAQRGRFLMVGDPKQSIYGWRGGTPGLIAKIEAEHGTSLGAAEKLLHSFRSAPLLMDFVNLLFGRLSTFVVDAVEPVDLNELTGLNDFLVREHLPSDLSVSAFKRAAEQWRFAEHLASDATLASRIEIYAVGSGDAEDAEDAENAEDAESSADSSAERAPALDAIDGVEVKRLDCAAIVAARIHQQYPQHTIGVLVRTNKDAAAIVAKLRRDGVAVSDEGASTLLDSPAVDGLVAVLELIDDPSNRIAHFVVSRGPLAAVTRLPLLESHASLEDAFVAASNYATTMRSDIARVGLAAVVASLAQTLLAQSLNARDAARVARCVALAESFADTPCARLTELIEAISLDKSEASSADKIRVMTIHKSKGLEFDEVVLASLDGAMGKTPTGWGVLATDPSAPPQLVAPLGNEAERAWVPELALFERDERRRRLLDDFSALYVAVTRAKVGLHLVIERVAKGKKLTAAKLLRKALDSINDESGKLNGAPALSLVLEHATPSSEIPCWSEQDGVMREVDASPSSRVLAVQTSPTPPHEPLLEIIPRMSANASAPSSHDAPSLWASSPFADSDIALRGVFVHECFRFMQSIEDFREPAKLSDLVQRAAIRAAVEKGEPIGAVLEAEVRALFEKLAHADSPCAKALSLAPSDRVHAELPFVRVGLHGGLTRGRIDRVVVHRDAAGTVLGATVIDYKTGAVGASADAMAEKVSNYREQLVAYSFAVAELWNLDAAAVRLELVFVDRGEVIRVH